MPVHIIFSILSDALCASKVFSEIYFISISIFPPVLDVEPTNKRVEKIGGKHVIV